MEVCCIYTHEDSIMKPTGATKKRKVSFERVNLKVFTLAKSVTIFESA
jgi:hypothetical protein